MSALLDSLLTRDQRAACAANEPGQRFRIEADWPGGGFGYTMNFPDAEAAMAWAREKAGFRNNAEITVTPRIFEGEPRFSEAQLLAAEVTLSADKAERFHLANDRRAMELQLRHPSELDRATWARS
jgi:hypothetical protein